MARDILVSLHGRRVGLDDQGNLIIDGVQVAPTPNPTGAQDYFVDGNVSATGRGDSWESPYLTLAEAIAASDISIALTANRWWARRNRIFVVADALSETLVKFPTKCDVIGMGAYDGNSMPGLTGHHVPIGESYSTRFFNIKFTGVAAAAAIITISSAAAGMQFHGCEFDALAGTLTSGILCTASHGLVVNNCSFGGTFATSYISFGAGEVGGVRIIGNRMLGTAAAGVIVDSSATDALLKGPLLQDNIIDATGLCLDDNADIMYHTGNSFISEADPTAALTGVVDANLVKAANNRVTGAAGTERNAPWPVEVIS